MKRRNYGLIEPENNQFFYPQTNSYFISNCEKFDAIENRKEMKKNLISFRVDFKYKSLFLGFLDRYKINTGKNIIISKAQKSSRKGIYISKCWI